MQNPRADFACHSWGKINCLTFTGGHGLKMVLGLFPKWIQCSIAMPLDSHPAHCLCAGLIFLNNQDCTDSTSITNLQCVELLRAITEGQWYPKMQECEMRTVFLPFTSYLALTHGAPRETSKGNRGKDGDETVWTMQLQSDTGKPAVSATQTVTASGSAALHQLSFQELTARFLVT